MKSAKIPSAESLPNGIMPGSFMYLEGETYQITSTDVQNGTHIEGESLLTQDRKIFSIVELFTKPASEGPFFALTLDKLKAQVEKQQPLVPQVYDPKGLRDSFMRKAEQVITLVEAVEEKINEENRLALKYGKPLKKTEALQRALQHLDNVVGLTTYYKYRSLYQENDGRQVQIAASLRRKSFNKLKTSSAVLHLVDTLITKYYMRPNREQIKRLYSRLRKILRDTDSHWVDPDRYRRKIVPEALVEDLLNENIPFSSVIVNPDHAGYLTKIDKPPSERWFYNYVHYLENSKDKGEAIFVSRYGKDGLPGVITPFDTYVTKAQVRLQTAFMDHWLVDMFILDEDDNPLRLWLTLVIDVFTRCILGMALLKEDPCIESVLTALQHVIWPKESQKQYGITDEWACYGIMSNLSLDNAWAHHSESVEELCRALKVDGRPVTINLDFRPPHKAQYGGVIEALFGNFSAKFKQLGLGAIWSKNRQDVRRAAQDAVYIEDDLRRLIHQLIVEYQHTPHSALNGMTPHEKWLESVSILGQPKIPILTPEVERLFWRLDTRPRVITNKGISAFGMQYQSPELSGAQRVRKNGKKVEYRIRYHPDNICQLAVFRDGVWIFDVFSKDKRLPDGSTLPISLAERELGKELARKAGQPISNWHNIVNAWHGLGEQRSKERQQRSRKKQVVPNEKFAPKVVDNALRNMRRDKQADDSDTELLLRFLPSKKSNVPPYES